MNAKQCKATPNYWTALNVEQGASKQKIVAAYRKMSQTAHPDHGGDEKLWALITAAFNALKTDPQHMWGMNGDSGWQRDYLAATKPTTEQPKTAGRARTKAPADWTFEEKDGESKDDRRKRYAREYQAARYAADPAFAEARRAASKKCNDAKRAKKAAAKNAPAAA